MKKLTLTMLLICGVALFASAQSIELSSGSLDFIKETNMLKVDFTYKNMNVGKLTEKEYIDKKVSEYNAKEKGKGDLWLKAWVSDRKQRYEPKFLELFNKQLNVKGVETGSAGAKYVMVVNTDFTEPGWNVGVMRQNASIDLTCTVKKIGSGEEVAVIVIRKASANNFWGDDFDSGYRIQETYAKAGRELAKYLIKKAKLK